MTGAKIDSIVTYCNDYLLPFVDKRIERYREETPLRQDLQVIRNIIDHIVNEALTDIADFMNDVEFKLLTKK